MKKIRIELIGVVTSLLLLTLSSSTDAAYAQGQSAEASGTFADTSFIILSTQVVGDKTVLLVTGSGVISGGLTGTYDFAGIVVIDSPGRAQYHVVDVCKCTFEGKSGTIVADEQGSGVLPGGQFQADVQIIKASGDLAGVSGEGTLQGKQDPATLLTSGTYLLHLTFR